MLSIFTNKSAMSSNNAFNKANDALTIAMQRLGTGKRINSTADDAAGLQIATRLQSQSNGMSVAGDNINKSKALLGTAEGAFDEVTNILFRMKDLATQAADDTNSKDDRTAMQGEFDALNEELNNIMSNTSYGSEKLLRSVSTPEGGTEIKGKLAGNLQFRIGASKDEVLNANFSEGLGTVVTKLKALTESGISGEASAGNEMIVKAGEAIDAVGVIRSALGARMNRLDHTGNNLANVKDNTDNNIGVIRDANIADESLKMSRQSMLMQSSQGMLLQSNQMGQMLLRFIS